MSAVTAGLRLRAPAGLLAELSDLKRVRVAGRDGSLAEGLFADAWRALATGTDAREVALATTARALAATRLAGVDDEVLAAGGLPHDARAAVLRAALDEACAGTVEPALAAELRDVLVSGTATAAGPGGPPGAVPGFVALLAAQPRAGATAPGRARLVLEPPESHADHCLVVAVGAVLLAPLTGADAGTAFCGALAHHLHNARMPDGGFAGEVLLGEHLHGVVRRFTEAALAELGPDVRERVRACLGLNEHLESSEARAVVAADVLDRVLQMRHHARAAAFTLDQALDELELVHPGPLQAYGLAVVEAAGLR